MAKKPYIIALEEHYQDPEVQAAHRRSRLRAADAAVEERLDDLGALRLREMDEAGIDFQVLSHSIPGLQVVDAEAGRPLGAPHQRPAPRGGARHPIAFPPSPRCRLPIRAPRLTNSNAP